MRLRYWRPVFELTACLWFSALPLAAQPRTESIDRPVEIGIQGGGEMSRISSGGDVRLTVTVPRRKRRSLEGFVGGYSGTNGFDIGVYGFQVKRSITRLQRPGLEPFTTVGLMGWADRFTSRDCAAASCRSHESMYVMPPVIGLIGFGAQYTMTPRMAVRFESQAALVLFVPVGVRVAAGVSVPLGRTTFQRSGR